MQRAFARGALTYYLINMDDWLKPGALGCSGRPLQRVPHVTRVCSCDPAWPGLTATRLACTAGWGLGRGTGRTGGEGPGRTCPAPARISAMADHHRAHDPNLARLGALLCGLHGARKGLKKTFQRGPRTEGAADLKFPPKFS
jgi:hypothetical protein